MVGGPGESCIGIPYDVPRKLHFFSLRCGARPFRRVGPYGGIYRLVCEEGIAGTSARYGGARPSRGFAESTPTGRMVGRTLASRATPQGEARTLREV